MTRSESPSMVALTAAVEESTIFMVVSSHVQTRNDASDETAKGPPV